MKECSRHDASAVQVSGALWRDGDRTVHVLLLDIHDVSLSEEIAGAKY